MSSWGRDKRQLYTLISNLHKSVRSRDDVSLITGLTIVKNLDNFQFQENNSEIKLQEIECVYDGLEHAINDASNKNPNQIISSYKTRVEPIMKNPARSQAHEQHGSYLLRQTLAKMDREQGVYREFLRRRGSSLIRALYDIGPARGPGRSAKLRDHHYVETYFAGKQE